MADVKFEVVKFALSTAAATNTQDITISGFGTPVAAIFILSGATADDTITANAIHGIGWTDGTNEYALGIYGEDALGTSETARAHRSDRVITVPNTAGGAELLGFGFSSWITNGVRIVVDDQSPSAFLCTCILIGGADTTNAFVGNLDDLGTGTSAVDITGVGFQPDLVFVGCIGHTTAMPDDQVQNIYSFGVGDRAGATQKVSMVGSQDGQGTTVNTGYIGNDSIVGQASTGSLLWDAVIEDYDADGFSINPNASAGSDIIGFLCLKFANSPDIALFDMVWPTADNYAETTPAFTPNFGLISSVIGPTARNTAVGADTYGLSYVAFDDTTINTLNATSQDNVTTTVDKSLHKTTLKILDDDGSTTAVAGTYAFDASGWDFTLSTNPAAEILGWGLAIGGTPADSTAPNLSAPSATSIDQTTVTLGATTDETNGTAYAVITAEGDQTVGNTSNAQVIAGSGGGVIWAVPSVSVTTTTIAFAPFSNMTPGTTYGAAIVHVDAATNEDAGSRVGGTFTMEDGFTVSATYDGSTIPSDSILHYAAGTSDSGSDTQMVDSGLVDSDDEFNGYILRNDTDVTSVIINDSTASSDTLDFTTGSVDFTSNDVYAITAPVASSDVIFCEDTVTVSSESVTIDYYLQDVSPDPDEYSAIYTQTITGLTGVADGNYSVALAVDGTITLTSLGGGGGAAASRRRRQRARRLRMQ